jgi:hypothetical protein
MTLAIEGDAQPAASFERRQPISARETRHMDHLPFEPWSVALPVQDGGRDGGHIRVVIRIVVVVGLERAP